MILSPSMDSGDDADMEEVHQPLIHIHPVGLLDPINLCIVRVFYGPMLPPTMIWERSFKSLLPEFLIKNIPAFLPGLCCRQCLSSWDRLIWSNAGSPWLTSSPISASSHTPLLFFRSCLMIYRILTLKRRITPRMSFSSPLSLPHPWGRGRGNLVAPSVMFSLLKRSWIFLSDG